MKEPKIIFVEKWIEKAGKLKKTYKEYQTLKKHCIKVFGAKYFLLKDYPDEKLIMVEPANVMEGGVRHDRMHGNRDFPIYEIQKDGKLKKFVSEDMIKELTPVLAKHIDREMLMKDVLYDLPPDRLREIHDRVITTTKKEGKKPKIKPSSGCFYLSIGGKPGMAEHLFIRE